MKTTTRKMFRRRENFRKNRSGRRDRFRSKNCPNRSHPQSEIWKPSEDLLFGKISAANTKKRHMPLLGKFSWSSPNLCEFDRDLHKSQDDQKLHVGFFCFFFVLSIELIELLHLCAMICADMIINKLYQSVTITPKFKFQTHSSNNNFLRLQQQTAKRQQTYCCSLLNEHTMGLFVRNDYDLWKQKIHVVFFAKIDAASRSKNQHPQDFSRGRGGPVQTARGHICRGPFNVSVVWGTSEDQTVDVCNRSSAIIISAEYTSNEVEFGEACSWGFFNFSLVIAH